MAGRKPKKVLVTGANGYIGGAVARSFVRAGWTTYGLVRKESAIKDLALNEIIPLLGSPGSPPSLPSWIHFNVIVSVTEQWPDYISHYQEIITFLRTLATAGNAAGVRPLVLFSSGCKDYGLMDEVATSTGLKPHTEDSPLNPPAILRPRSENAVKTFENVDLFDTVLLRPTNVYGLGSSYYGDFFKLDAAAKERGKPSLLMNAQTILHALHVDDCGDAYVAIAENLEVVKQQSYNISSYRFETLDEIAQSLAKEYGVTGGVKYLPLNYGPDQRADTYLPRVLFGFSQWTGSEKLRKDTGWEDRRLLFSEGIHQYRLAYEAATAEGYKPFDLNVLTAQG
ncbi:hypothetical protein B0O99DRAFT_725355 [Bisporella sp. PMI_857]|nr:hypothetical protein B0O99DRAFT_725355 [Bisporella sp. PMI_857]